MASIDDLLNMANAPEPTTPELKKRAVELSSAEKLKALGGLKPNTFENVATASQSEGQGASSASPIETDLRNLSDMDLRDKYGDTAESLISDRNMAAMQGKALRDLSNSGGGIADTLQNTAVGAIHGLSTIPGAIAYVGSAGVDAVLGTTSSTTVAEANKNISDWINKGHTAANEADTKVSNQQQALNERDNQKLYEERTKDPNTGFLTKADAYLRNVGQDFIDGVDNLSGSGEQLTNLTGEMLGSVGGIGLLSKAGTKALEKGISKYAAKQGLEKTSPAIAKLEKYGQEAVTQSIIGITEGGSVASEAVNKVMAMKTEDLLKDPVHGEEFAKLVKEHGAEKAKEILAKDIGLSVASKTLPTALALGKLTSKFEGDPLKKLSTKSALAAIATQAVEETLQEGTGQAYTNYDIKNKAKSDQSLTEGVGTAAASGFMGGVMGTSTLKSPELSAEALKQTSKITGYLGKTALAASALGVVGKYAVNKIYTGVISKIGDKSPVSDTNVSKSAEAAVTASEPISQVIQQVLSDTNSSPEVVKAAEHTQRLLEALKFEAPPEGVIPPIFEEAFKGVTTTIGASQKLANIINDKNTSEDDRFMAIENLHGMLSGITDVLSETDAESIRTLTELPELQEYGNSFTALFNSFKDSPAMQGVIHHFDNILETGIKLGHYKPIDVNDLSNPEQQVNLDKILKVAVSTNSKIPESLENQINTVMDMINDGQKVDLTEPQKAAIRGLAIEIKVAKEISKEANAAGLTNVDFVNKQISLDSAAEQTFKYPSVREHNRGIVAALNKGDIALAASRMQVLQNFVTHFNNKVAALNEHIQTAKDGVDSSVKYMAYRSRKGAEWSESKKGVYVNFNSANSLLLAKTTALENLTLTNVFNQLAKAYPELKFKTVTPVNINIRVFGNKTGKEVHAEIVKGNNESLKNTNTKPPLGNNNNNKGKDDSDSNDGSNTENLDKWTTVVNKHKGIINLNKNREKLSAEDSQEVIDALESLPKDFKTANKELQSNLYELRKYFLGENNNSGKTPEQRWADLITKFKGIKNLNEKKEKLATRTAEIVKDILEALPENFTVSEKLQKDFEELNKYFGIGSKPPDEDNGNSNSSNDDNNSGENQNPNTPAYLASWLNMLSKFKGIARLNESKKRLSSNLADKVLAVLQALPKDFTVDEEYQQDFNEIKEYFLGKSQEEENNFEPVEEVSLIEVFDNITTGVSSTGNNTFVPNVEQAEGIKKIKEFLNNRSGGNIFVLEGKAGTGKTSLIQEAVGDILARGGKVNISAVSHKAKGVLEKKLKSYVDNKKLSGKVRASSLAGLLGMKRDEETGDFVDDPYGEATIDKVEVLIVDEASMVNAQNKQVLESRLPKGAKLIYVGDRNQIAPIEKPNSPNLGKISQVFTMNVGKNKHSLVTRVRQGEDSTILPYADYYWNNAEGKTAVADPVPEKARKNSKEMIMLKPDGWVDKVIPLFKKAFETGNANLVKVMAFNNISGNTKGAKMLKEAENKIREALFGEDREEYNKGELLMMTSNFSMGDKGTLENSAELVAISSKSTKQSVPLPDGSEEKLDAFKLEVKDTNSGIQHTITVIAESSKERHKQIYQSWANHAKQNRSSWPMFWAVKEQLFAPVSYSYIITTHKAQGSTYDVAVVLEDNINTSPDTIANKSRIMYTAITRPSKLAVIVSNRNPDLPITLVDGSAVKKHVGNEKFYTDNITPEPDTSNPEGKHNEFYDTDKFPKSKESNSTSTPTKIPNVQIGNDPEGGLNQQANLTAEDVYDIKKPTEPSSISSNTNKNKGDVKKENLNITAEHLLSPDHVTSVETGDGQFDSIMQAVTVSLYRHVAKTPENHAIMLEALTTTDPDKLRELQGKYKDPNKNFKEKLVQTMNSVIHNYVYGNKEVRDFLLANANQNFDFSDQNSYWKSKIPNMYKEITKELQAVEKLPVSKPIASNPTFSELFKNLRYVTTNRFLKSFKLRSDNVNNLLNQESPLSYMVQKLNEVSDTDSGFKKQAKHTWQSLIVSEIPNAVNALNKNIQQFLNTKAKITAKTLDGSVAKIIITALSSENGNDIISKVVSESGFTKSDLDSLNQFVSDESYVKTTPKRIQELERKINSFLNLSKNAINNKILNDEVLVSTRAKIKEMSDELANAKERLESTKLYDKLNAFKTALIKVQDSIDVMDMAHYRDLLNTPNGKILNLVTPTESGYQVDNRISESMFLAGLSWIANASMVNNLDKEDVADILGIKEKDVTKEQMYVLNNHIHSSAVIQGIADTLKSFLNLQDNKNVNLGDTDGLLLSLAANTLDVLVEGGLIELRNIQVRTIDEAKNEIVKEHNYFSIRPFIGTIYRNVPEVLEDAVLEESERSKKYALGSNKNMPVDKNIKHSPIEMTQDQRDMIEKAQNIPNTVNMLILDFYEAIGDNGLIELFGHGELDEDLMHPMDYVSKSGKNASIRGAWEKSKAIIKEALAFSENKNIPIEKVKIFYRKGVTSVGRLQFDDSYNMQSSKITRPLIVATKKTVDMTNPKEEKYFLLGIAQGIGIKIHNMSAEKSILKLNEILGSEQVKEVFKLLDSGKKNYSESDIATLKAVMPLVDNTEWGLTSLVEYHRYKSTPKEQLSKFVHSVAVEADGVTNGSANALHILASKISSGLLSLWRMTGYFIGNDTQTLNQEREINPTDIYLSVAEKGTEFLAKNIIEVRGKLEPQNRVIVDDVISLIKILNMSIKIDDSGNIVLTRPSTKNPVTVTLYGSSDKGITEKLLSTILKELYSQISLKIQGKGILTSPEVHAELSRVMSNLTKYRISNVKDPEKKKAFELELIEFQKGFTTLPAFDAPNADWKRFDIGSLSQDILVANLQKVYTAALSKAIEEVIGVHTNSVTGKMITVSKLHALILQDYYEGEIARRIDERLKTNPNYRRSDYLPKAELEEIRKSVMDKLSGVFSDEYQNSTVYLTTKKSSIFGLPITGASISDGNKSYPSLPTFENPSVSIAPNMVIRTDGLAIQHFINNPDNDINSLPIFDGIMMNSSDIEKGAYLANKAVFSTWTEQTPVRLIADAFAKVAKVVDINKLSLETVMLIQEEYYGYLITEEDVKKENITTNEILTTIAATMDREATAIEAQQELVKALPSYVDHMAGVGSYYRNEGTITQEELDAGVEKHGFVDFLNIKLEEIKNKNKKEIIKPSVEDKKVEVFTYPEIKNILRNRLNSMSKAARVTFESIIDSFRQSDFTILVGDMDAVADKLDSMGHARLAEYARTKKTKGTIFHKEKIIILGSYSELVLLHEMVHASVSRGLSFGLSKEPAITAVEKRARQAAKQLRILLKEFMSDEFVSNFEPNSLGEERYLIIKDFLKSKHDGDEYSQINEMLAYLLPDERTREGLEKAKTEASIPAKFLASIKRAISYFFSSSNESEVKNFYANLVFHSTTLAESNADFIPNTPEVSNYGLDNESSFGIKAKLGEIIKNHLKGKDVLTREKYALEKVHQSKVTDLVLEAGYLLNQEEYDAYSAIFLAMKMGLDTNNIARNQLQDLYSSFINSVSVKDFYPANADQHEKEVALDKYDALLGRYKHGSKIVPEVLANFAALAYVSEEVREVLGKVVVKKYQLDSSPKDAFDSFMGSIGDRLIDSLSNYSSKVDGTAKSVNQYFDSIMNVLFSSQENILIKENTALNTIKAKGDKLNDAIAKGIQSLSSKSEKNTESLRASNNKAVKTAGNLVTILNSIINKDIAEVAAKDINKQMNRLEGFQELRDLMRDLIGRTTDNAAVWDLVKPVRTSVDKLRQNYKTQVPLVIQNKFKYPLSKSEYKSLGISLGKTNLFNIGIHNVTNIANGKFDVDARIKSLESNLSSQDSNYFKGVQEKAMQLAKYNITGNPGHMLLRNAFAVAHQFGRGIQSKPSINKQYLNKVTELVSLYSYQLLDQSDKDTLSNIINRDKEGIIFINQLLLNTREKDNASAEVNLEAKVNGYFNYLPMQSMESGSLIVAKNSDYTDLISKGYRKVGDYIGDSRDPEFNVSKGYYYNPLDLGQEYKQGVLINIQGSTHGVDLESGLSTSKYLAGAIYDPVEVKKILKRPFKESDENLLPIFNSAGAVVGFERIMSAKQISKLDINTDISELIGAMRGRQLEEDAARVFLSEVAKALKDSYDADTDKTQYVDLFDDEEVAKDKVLSYGVGLFSHTAKEEIRRVFGNSFYVKREMLTDVVGFRKASVTDIFTGISRYSPETITQLRKIAIAVFGANAYKYLSHSERYLQEGVSFIRTNIAIKSVVVPVSNILSNAVHLMSIGVSPVQMINAIPKKLAELEHFVKAKHRLIAIEVEITAARNIDNQKLKTLFAEKKSIESTLERMSIAPLIIAGELSNINDVGLNTEDDLLLSGKLKEYVDALVEKTPKGILTTGKHLLVWKNTALFNGLQKSVLYGDFIAKAIMYDHLTKNKGIESKEAVARVSSEFISYDHLPGRGRDYLESIGLLWFYNYKLRSLKVALNTIRNNPLYALMFSGLGATQLGIDTPIDSNVVSQVFDGSVGYSLGLGMGFDGMGSNPYVQLIS